MIIRIFAAFVFAIFLFRDAAANPADAIGSKEGASWVDPGWRRSIARYYVKFDEQGLSTTTLDFEFQAVSDKGAAAIAQRTFEYNSYFSDLTVSNLVTVKADGSIVAVDERAIRDQPASTDTSSPYFDERRVKLVAYPDVARGDRIRGRLTYTDKRPEFPGEFAGFWDQRLDLPPETMELTLDGPASKPVQVKVRDVDYTEERVGDRILKHVVFRQESPRRFTGGFDPFDSARRFEASTFADYAAFASMMNARNAPMAVPDESVRKLSAEIVGDAATTRAKVERVHNWVAQHIRYVGIGFEDGGWTAQPASSTLAVRYGDCKAHAVLLKALLAAQGIEADFVAVNSRSKFTLTQLATPNFDHAIAYVPELDLYLDPTASTVAFGALPSQLYGKPVLNIDKGVLSVIPVLKPEQFAIEDNTDYTLRPDGTRQIKSILSGEGFGASLVRDLARYAETTDRNELARKSLQAANLVGTGTYDFANPREPSDSFAIKASYEITQPIALDELAWIRPQALANPYSSIRSLIANNTQEGDFPCLSMDYREMVSLDLPVGSHISEIPGPVAFNKSFSEDSSFGAVSGQVELSGAFTIKGQTARSEDHIKLTFSAPVCPAGFVAEIKDGLSKFDEFSRAWIALTPKPVSTVVESGSDYAKGLEAYRAKNYTFALLKFVSAADRGNVDACNYIGTMYHYGQGVPQDYHQAASWYDKAAQQGNALSQAHLGYMYETGLGVALDRKQALDWYRKAADQGDTYSQISIGNMYEHGEGVKQDYGRAMQWFLKAAEQDDAVAQTRVAFMYEQAKGVSQDYAQAAHWYRRAADLGDEFAQLQLGTFYAYGRGVPLDYGIAVEWYRKAAAQGDTIAQYDIGYAYEKGLGVAQDNPQAMEWYRRAVNKGYPEAQSRLDALSGTGFWHGFLHRVWSLAGG